MVNNFLDVTEFEYNPMCMIIDCVDVCAFQGVFGVLSIPAGLVILVGMMLQEPLVHSYSHKRVRLLMLG